MLNKLYFWWYRRRNFVPHKNEILQIYKSIKWKIDDPRWNRRRIGMANAYCWGSTLEEIADHYNVPRERVRQVLRRFYRDNEIGRLNE